MKVVIRFCIKLLIVFQNLILSFIVSVLFHSNPRVNPETILVFRSSRLGDFICAIPGFFLLRKRFPKAHILLLTFTSLNRKMWKLGETPDWIKLCQGLFDEIIALSGPEVLNKVILNNLRKRIRRLDPNLCFMLPFAWEGFASKLKKLMFLRFLGVKQNIYGWGVRRLLLFKKAHSYFENIHEVLGPIEALQEYPLIGRCSESDIQFQIAASEEDKNYVEKIWIENGLTDFKVISVFPGATFAHKRWPIENFRVLCRLLLIQYPVRIIVIGGKKERELGVEIKREFPERVFNIAGDTTLGQTAEILRRSCLFVGNDSGPAHLAAAVGTKCVTLFSSIQFPGSWEPWGNRHTSLRHSVPCEFCFSYDHCPTGTMACIRGITVAEVFDSCKRTLDN